MSSSKPKKGFSMYLGKLTPSSSSLAAATKKGGDRGANIKNSKSSSAIGVEHGDDNNDEGAGASRRDYVTGIGEGKVVTKEVVVDRGPRVIALASNPWANGSAKGSATTGSSSSAGAVPPPVVTKAAASDEPAPEKSLDQLAAEAIAAESRRGSGRRNGGADSGSGLGLDSNRVIGMAGKISASSSAAAAATGGAKMRMGLLEQNMIPGLMDVEGEDAKFKHDLGHRAEDVSARSQSYVDVPVAEFGAALLRGMGWKGPEADGGGGIGPDLSKEVEPRHHRLGLGAQPKPPEEMKKPRKRKPGEKPRASEAERLKIWEQKVKEERLRAASESSGAEKKLSVMDVVELSEGGARGAAGRRLPRAMVLKTQGVPGLDKISVRMEDTGEKVIVDRTSAIRVSEDDLARWPFSESKKNKASSSKSSGGSNTTEEGNSGGGGGGDINSSTSSRRRRERDGDSPAPHGHSKRSRSRSDGSRGSDSGSEERGGDERERRDSGGGTKTKKSKSDKKKHKKSSSSSSSSSKRERERDRDRNSDGWRGSPSPLRHNDERHRDTGRRDRRSDGDDSSSGTNARSRYDRRRGPRDNGSIAAAAAPDRKRPRDMDDGDGHDGTQGHHTGNGKGSGGGAKRRPHTQPDPGTQSWLRTNIRVRVVHKSYVGGRAYLGKGRVVDVPRVGQATVRMDLGDLILEGVKERHLETVLPARGGKVIVVRGAEKGVTGKLLARNKEQETALLQVYEDLRALTLSLDDVAEFTGMLDEDMDDVGY